MQKKMSKDGKLYDVDKTAKEETYEIDTWSTTAFEINLKSIKGEDNAAERLIEKLDQRNKLGALNIPQDEHKNRKIEFIQTRMKALVPNATGEEFEQSKEALYKAIFGDK